MHAMCVPMDFAGTDKTAKSIGTHIHFEGRAFPTATSAAPEVKDDPWFTHTNTLIKY